MVVRISEWRAIAALAFTCTAMILTASSSASALTYSGNLVVQGVTESLRLLPPEGERVSEFNGGLSGESLKNTTSWVFSDEEISLTFDFEMGGGVSDFAPFSSQLQTVFFQIEEPTAYVLDGFMWLESGLASGINYRATLAGPPIVFDPTRRNTIHYDYNTFTNAGVPLDEWDMELGDPPFFSSPGEDPEYSRTGVLEPGSHILNFTAGMRMEAPGPAKASGTFRITFVPEPTPAILLSIGLAVLGSTRKARRSG
jgi:hypothetical protein